MVATRLGHAASVRPANDPSLRLSPRYGTPLLLLGLTVGFFWKVALTGEILTGYDTFAYFYPYLSATAEAIRNLRLPLWNPDVFLGAPLAANLQTAIFYPATLLYLILPTGNAVSWDIILHTFLAAWFMYLLARRSVGLSHAGALAAGIAFAFSGFFAAQAGHVNQLTAAAWLPLLLLIYSSVTERPTPSRIAAGSLIAALVFLAGHSQEAFMIFCVIAARYVWASAGATLRALDLGLPPGPDLPRSAWLAARMVTAAIRVNIRGLTVLALILGGGALLAAIQLVPSIELASLSVRSGGMSYRQAVSFSLNPLQLVSSLLPGYWQNPFSEYIGYVGVTGILLAIVGARDVWHNKDRSFYLAVAAAGLVLSLGGYTPLYLIGYLLLPGFSLFRVPARWLYLYTFGMAMLVGIGLDALIRRAGTSPAVARGLLTTSSTAALRASRFDALPSRWSASPWLSVALGTIALIATATFKAPPPLAWAALAVSMLWLMRRPSQSSGTGSPSCSPAILSLLVIELFVASRGMEYNQPAPPESLSALRPALAHLLTDEEPFRVLSLSNGLFDPGDLADIRTMMPLDVATQFATATKNKEILAPNTPMLFGIESVDGYDGGILPLKRYVELQQLFMNPWLVSVDGRLREQLTEVPDTGLLSLLNVKYVLADKVNDVWVDNVYYDLGTSTVISPSAPVWTSGALPAFPTGAVGIVSHLVGAADVPDDSPVASVTVRSTAGRSSTYMLRAGRDTAEGIYLLATGAAAQHKQARIVANWRSEPQGKSYLALIPLDADVVPQSLEVRYTWPRGRLVLRGITQIDQRANATQSVVTAPTDSLRLVHSGDVKLYENTGVLPRVFTVHQAQVFQTSRAVLDAMAAAEFDPARTAVLVSDGLDTSALRTLTSGHGDEVTVHTRESERVEINATMGANGLLVLSDMWYPGWRAFVDGVEQPLFRVYHVFRGVVVPQGAHGVEIIYDAGVWRLGAMVSAAAWVALVVCLAWSRRSRKGKGAASSPRPP